MPLYKFACGCGRKQEVTWPMSRSKELLACGCGEKMYRVYSFHNKGMSYKRPIHSDSLAISPSQRTEHEQRFPDIKLDSANRPIFDNVQTHQKYLDDCNIVKDRQKLKPEGVRIT
ncbi:hypothetical protein LCGC14_0447770 [marine sediment metagenome]|uniref:Putative regulatory protein FmdB zinc ribbon domain-containing protein n=1 Tax=marine sediment metagenome TaxID=412755 RepID=A0A0F9T1S5_9ZZZZ